MKPQSHFTCAVLVSVLFLTGCAESGGDSPEAAFSNFKSAVGNNDWKTATQQMTVESQDGLASMMLMVAPFSMMMDPENAEAKQKSFEALLAKHGIEEPKTDENAENKSADAAPQNPTDAGKDMKDMLANVKDKPALIGDLMAWVDKNSKGGDKMMVGIETSELKDVKIDGQKATGTLVMTKDGETSNEPIEFRQVDGKWYIHLPMEG